MSTVPFTKESYKEYIRNGLGNDENGRAYVKEIDPVTQQNSPMFDNMCNAITKAVTDNVKSNTKDRLDLLEIAYESLLTAIGTMANTFSITGSAPVVGSALGTALTTLKSTASANSSTRASAKTAQSALLTPYIDGKS